MSRTSLITKGQETDTSHGRISSGFGDGQAVRRIADDRCMRFGRSAGSGSDGQQSSSGEVEDRKSQEPENREPAAGGAGGSPLQADGEGSIPARVGRTTLIFHFHLKHIYIFCVSI